MAHLCDLIDILANNRAGVEPSINISGYCPCFANLMAELVHEEPVRNSETRHYENCLAVEAGIREFGCLHSSEYWIFGVELTHGRPD
jgi:hypothetical protein